MENRPAIRISERDTICPSPPRISNRFLEGVEKIQVYLPDALEGKKKKNTIEKAETDRNVNLFSRLFRQDVLYGLAIDITVCHKNAVKQLIKNRSNLMTGQLLKNADMKQTFRPEISS